MLFAELLERVGENALGVHRILILGPALELQQQALGQVARADAGRVEALHHAQYGLYLGHGHFQVLRERQVVGNGRKVAPDVAVAVNRADELLANGFLALVEVGKVQLVEQRIQQRAAGVGQGGVALLLFAWAVALHLVAGYFIVVEVLAQVEVVVVGGVVGGGFFLGLQLRLGHLVGGLLVGGAVVKILVEGIFVVVEGGFGVVGLVAVVLVAVQLLGLVVGLVLFQGWVHLHFLFDAGLQLGRRNLQQLNKLNLLRAKLLGKELFEVEALHRNEITESAGRRPFLLAFGPKS
ncbi:MAG: hypothetical protein NVS3B25_20270 [Hymenobacter sp.]